MQVLDIKKCMLAGITEVSWVLTLEKDLRWSIYLELDLEI